MTTFSFDSCVSFVIVSVTQIEFYEAIIFATVRRSVQPTIIFNFESF